jgi:hypothetical protein
MITKDEAIQKAIDFLDGSYAAHAVRKALQEALEQPAWQGLTDAEIEYWECLKAPPVHPDFLEDDSWREFARCIEKALKEKNHG